MTTTPPDSATSTPTVDSERPTIRRPRSKRCKPPVDTSPSHSARRNTLSDRIHAVHRDVLRQANELRIDPALLGDRLYAAYNQAVQHTEAKQASTEQQTATKPPRTRILRALIALFVAMVGVVLVLYCGRWTLAHFRGVRCLLPNNYLVWEATRPLSDCAYCRDVRSPLLLGNVSQEEFRPFAFAVRPIVLKGAVAHWTAAETLNFEYLRRLYRRDSDEPPPAADDEVDALFSKPVLFAERPSAPAPLRTYADECQFLNFESNFLTPERFFAMPAERARTGQPPWYVGLSNCQPAVLRELRRHYPLPHFLPDDAEVPNSDFLFMGFDRGAIMHLDYISRLMWQAQLRGTKRWTVAPTPECALQCERFEFVAEAGDAVLLDTRNWYHATSVLNGEFSLTVQSEYG